jgi:hypothetical protein
MSEVSFGLDVQKHVTPINYPVNSAATSVA